MFELKNEPINPEDMCVLYGFSLFETFLVNRKGHVFLLEEHVNRLFNSINYFKFNIHLDKTEMVNAIQHNISSNGISNMIFRLTAAYGNEPKCINPSITYSLRHNPYNSESYSKGARLTLSGIPKAEDSLIISHKTSNYLENYLVLKQALGQGFDDAIFINTSHYITETTKSNIFFVSKGLLHTPHISCGLLPGIMRGWVTQMAGEMGIPCKEGRFTVDELFAADEIFVTNSVFGIMPVTQIDNYYSSFNKPIEITECFMRKYKTRNSF